MAGRYLYVASGACYSGNNTTFSNLTSSNMIYRIDLSSGQRDLVIGDYWASPSSAGDSPVGIAQMDTNHIYALIENTSTGAVRRVEKIEKASRGVRSIVSNNVTALNAQLRSLLVNSAGDFLISKSTAVEYITSTNGRIGAPFISASAAPCNSSTTLISKLVSLPNGKIVFLHAAAGQNRFGIFNSTGGTTCASAQAAPNANSYPTAAFYDSEHTRLIVAYSGNALTTDINSIYAYSIDESTAAITDPQKIYDASLYPSSYNYLLYGVSEMAYDSQTKSIYIATAITASSPVVNYAIEKFSYNANQIGIDNNKVLVRSSSSPFYSYGNDTRCISQMMISN